MKDIGRLVIKLFIALFTLLFIFPAIIFSVLVLGLTDSWKSGTVMLISALILKMIMHFNYISQPPSRTRNKIASRRIESGYYMETQFRNQPPPPPLSDIYREIDLQYGENDVLYKTILDLEYENQLIEEQMKHKKKLPCRIKKY
ncbi:MAG TPA: hypothetical protein VL921_15775 [Candidatus Udaeobacter sp.]|nr:hypothetical protein [Candidatus Udaeobacter sp.]